MNVWDSADSVALEKRAMFHNPKGELSYGRKPVIEVPRTSDRRITVLAIGVVLGVLIVSSQVALMSVWRPYSPGIERQLEIARIARGEQK